MFNYKLTNVYIYTAYLVLAIKLWQEYTAVSHYLIFRFCWYNIATYTAFFLTIGYQYSLAIITYQTRYCRPFISYLLSAISLARKLL